MDFNATCRAIKEVKIQGARNVAIAATKALLYRNDKSAVQKLINLRPTEPALRNSLKFANSYKEIKQGVNFSLQHFDSAEKRIIELGEKRIEDRMNIFTHCHSSIVNKILIAARKKGKYFTVHCTETRPLFQGRITAAQLSKAGIPVYFYIDSAARIALKKCDLMLLGADAITSTKIYNKIGSEMFAEIAQKYEVPVYICTDSWKFDPETKTKEKVEERSPKEVWPNAPRKINIENPAFEKIDPYLIEAIISELGVYDHTDFVTEVKRIYPWMLK